ncbi:TetR/AcrR family transcriptional regulator [Marinibactrum halimedae]|uniref:TetR family transcriptional regulator n=1 Tax=Marinibactrum halimedae TaxID=1444977 RepID=A0AA37T4D5_9GAMM|nr:TetR/AcrR family transcriptional regulator [Marinibactrum halimedae]MCD9457769.1 TetR/AcrR family transcriptional regulator [Marinibactrum halimedae]GLS24857.1 TetR family transcriptional regulator [Marinibactrum halimedae]
MARKALTPEQIEAYRKKLCETAYALYLEKGYEAVSMRALGTRMGSSAMMAYSYFESKDDVFATIRAGLFQRLGESLSESLEQAQSSQESGLQALFVEYAQFAQREPKAYQLLYLINQPGWVQHPATVLAHTKVKTLLLEQTKKEQHNLVIQGEAEVVAHILWASLHGLITLELSGQLHHGHAFKELLPAMHKNFFKQV